MNIQRLGPDKLRILLNSEDLEKYKLDYFSISTDSKSTMNLLNEILKKSEASGFISKNARILVEVLPDTNNGCILYVTKIKAKSTAIRLRLKEPQSEEISTEKCGYLIIFETLEDAIEAIKRFERYTDIALKESRFYKLGKHWFLTFEPVIPALDSNRLIALLADLSEYGDTENRSDISEAVLEEHGEIIADSHAIEKFLRYFI